MRGSNRVLIIAAAAVMLLAIVTAITAMITQGNGRLMGKDSPEGVVQRFLLAMESGNYMAAYNYLAAEPKDNCTYNEFLDQRNSGQIEDIQASLIGTDTFGDRAEVTITITQFRTSGPFLGPFESPTDSYQQTYLLRQEEGDWHFSHMPWPVYWCPSQESMRSLLTPAP